MFPNSTENVAANFPSFIDRARTWRFCCRAHKRARQLLERSPNQNRQLLRLIKETTHALMQTRPLNHLVEC